MRIASERCLCRDKKVYIKLRVFFSRACWIKEFGSMLDGCSSSPAVYINICLHKWNILNLYRLKSSHLSKILSRALFKALKGALGDRRILVPSGTVILACEELKFSSFFSEILDLLCAFRRCDALIGYQFVFSCFPCTLLKNNACLNML